MALMPAPPTPTSDVAAGGTPVGGEPLPWPVPGVPRSTIAQDFRGLGPRKLVDGGAHRSKA